MNSLTLISTDKGFVLYFPSRETLEGTIKHLEGMVEHLDQNDVKPPYLYCAYDWNISKEEIADLLGKIKEWK